MFILTLFQSFSKIWTFQHFYKSALSKRWEQNVEIGMVEKKRYEIQVYSIIYSEYFVLYDVLYVIYIVLYNIYYVLYTIYCLIYSVYNIIVVYYIV